MRAAIVTVAVLLAVWTPMLSANSSAGGPQPRTIAGWQAYVSATEARIHAELASASGFLVSDFSLDRRASRESILKGEIPIHRMSTLDRSGEVLQPPGGTVAHWRGAVLLPGIRLEPLLRQLQYPDAHGPYPDDVLSLRVLDRGPDRLTLAMRLTRTKIVTVTYDTEHVAFYRRLAPSRASSRSVSTKIVEVANAGTNSERVLADGQDRGFLWRMNSYWRYQEIAGGVIVELESITLSRDIPVGLGLVVEPMIDRLAHESVTRTLASVRRLYSRPGSDRGASPR